MPIGDLTLYDRNARTHDDKQIDTLVRSLQSFGFINPVLIDRDNSIIAGHGRVEVARRLEMECVPMLCIDGLSADQLRAYRLADNRLAQLAGWDNDLLAIELQHLGEVELDFGIEAIGWEAAEIDMLIDGFADGENGSADDPDDEVQDLQEDAVSCIGDLWLLGKHRLLCGSALEAGDFDRLMQGHVAQMLIQDPPWNRR